MPCQLGFYAIGGQRAFTVHVAEGVRTACIASVGPASRSREPASEAGTGPNDRGEG